MWSQEQYARALKMRRDGMSAREIGLELGFSRETVTKYFSYEAAKTERAVRAKLKPYPRNGCPWTEEETRTLREGLDMGLTTEMLSQRLGRSEGGIRERFRALGIFMPKEPTPKTPIVVSWSLGTNDPEHVRRQETFKACRQHLADLVREHGGGTLGSAKGVYASKHELAVEMSYAPYRPRGWFDGSALGSPAAMCVE